MWPVDGDSQQKWNNHPEVKSNDIMDFRINGVPYTVNYSYLSRDTSLNTFLRSNANLRGTKFMCLEGGCGACIVAIKGLHPVTKTMTTFAVNSCLFPLFSCQGFDVITVEGIGNKKDGYHPVQSRLAHLNGTQCGYCSPGMVMNMYSLLEAKNGELSMAEIENSFGGNMCRCTGYRPILDAFKSLAVDADEKLKTLCKDIEDLPTKNCPKTGTPCAGNCHVSDLGKKSLHLIFENNTEWYKVFNLKDIFEILNGAGDRPYMLVGGNTAHGVYRLNPDIEIFIDVSGVEELRQHAIGHVLEIGGNVALTEFMDILKVASRENSEFNYCLQLYYHVDLIANVPVRNVGTIAGNLSIKHEHPEFPSDIFLILETVGAKLTITDGFDSKIVTVSDYLKADMNKKVIVKISFPPLELGKFIVRTYKIMPRSQNAHAYVNAGFLFEFNDKRNQLLSARICFGGINPHFFHAFNTERCVAGKDLFNNQNVQQILDCLARELNADWVLPDASPEYRKKLALGLLYKAILHISPDDKVSQLFKSGGSMLERTLSSGTQIFDIYEKNFPLTQPVLKLEALIQCSGEAHYMNDLPCMPGELWAAFVVGTKINGKIKRIDPSAALKQKGVQGFFCAKDIPGKNNFTPLNVLFITEEEEIFCSEKILFHGQPVGMIVAESFALAHSAANLVQIVYEEETKKDRILTSIKDVLDENVVDRIRETLSKKAIKYGLNSTHQLSGQFEVGGQYHYTMETQTCICVPTENGLEVHSSTQWMDLVQIAIADCLGISENCIDMKVLRLGGGLGGKISRSGQIGCAAALACHLLNRPIRFVMSLEQNMTAIGKRYSSIDYYDVTVDSNGHIEKMKNEFLTDLGCSLNEDPSPYTIAAIQNVYDSSAWDINSKIVRTDAVSGTWCRAPGNLEGMAMIENIMEHIAKKVGIDATIVRLNNIPEKSPMRKYLPEFIKSTEYEKRKKIIQAFNAANRWRKRGISIVPMNFHLEYFGTLHALVSIYHGDGSVSITHGGIEIGQGVNTKAAQIAAHSLGIPLNLISIRASNVITTPNATCTGGSQTSDAVGLAVLKACEMLNNRMKSVKSKMPKATWPEVVQACHNDNVDLCATYMFKVPDIQGYDIWGLCCSEVELDVLTGNVQVMRVDILEDTGESLSPNIDVGQVEGAFIMGLGYWLHENLIFNRENGELLTNRTWTYKPPGAKDIPIDFRVTFLQKSSNSMGILRSKSTGEPALSMSVSVIFALRQALDSARSDAGLNDNWYNMGAPCTVEQLFLLAGNKMEDFKLT